MRVNRIEYLIDEGDLLKHEIFQNLLDQVLTAIKSITWPAGSKSFTIFPGKHANGVKPIKEACMASLLESGWSLEKQMWLGSRLKPGRVDAVVDIKDFGNFAVEWETGNISSSHRALNKMALGLKDGELIGGLLIVPSREFYPYLTDRIGNFAEIEPYFPIWRDIEVSAGLLGVIEIEHDNISKDVPTIKKGTDGRALR